MYTTNSDSELTQQKQQLLSFFLFVKAKRLFVIVMILLGIGLGLIYSIVKKPVYTSSLTFTLQEESKMGSGGGLLSLASSFGLDVGGASGLFSGENIEQVFKSRKILERTLFQPYQGSTKTYGDKLSELMKINASFSESEISITSKNIRLRDSIISVIYKYLEAGYLDIGKPDKKYDIYEITFKGTEETFAKMFVQELVNQVAIFYTETKTKKAKQNVDVLQKRVDSIHDAIGDLIYQKANLSDANLNPIFQKVKVPEQKRQVDLTALGAGYGELLKNLELSKYTLLKETPLFQIIDEPKFPLKKKTFNPILYSLLGGFVFAILAMGLLILIKLYSNFKSLLTSQH
jgi:hypothetical protein